MNSQRPDINHLASAQDRAIRASYEVLRARGFFHRTAIDLLSAELVARGYYTPPYAFKAVVYGVETGPFIANECA